MKEVVAIIRMNMMNKTKRALSDAGIFSLTARDALGRGKGLVDMMLLKGAEQGYEEAISQLGERQRLIPKRILFIVVKDNIVEKAVKTIIKVNQTGKSGDGKILIMHVADSVLIRTGEKGETTIDE